ncbi:hypothetical protein Y032_0055g2627 [Ancylostoma ceylanicum]|uniref:Peptidase M13 C-terminal domain-containing protein n=1 Tax=Ancylostoma ceylanicum TaxID=53326 RepID=A0A016U5J7_9BILA|nr:hypothetical protein Y032_0055g2627 [Ancylostoma ceylanicum]
MQDFNNEKAFFIAYATVGKFLYHNEVANSRLIGCSLIYNTRFQLHCTRTSLKGMKQMIALDTHSLESLRVNNVLANIPEFSETFNCAPGTRMNPEKRCSMGACRSQASQYVHGFRHWTDPNKVTISENRQIQVLYKKIERRQTARAEGEGQEGKSKEKTGQTVQKFNALGILCCLTYSTVCIVVVAAV